MPLVRNKVMFHGANDGIGAMFETLNQQGIPFMGKSVDDAGFALEMVGYSNTYGVNNIITLRYVTIEANGHTYYQMVPDYTKHPEAAAEEMYQALLIHLDNHAQALYPYKDKFRIEIGNELKTHPNPDEPNYNDMHPADWLGWYGYYISLRNERS